MFEVWLSMELYDPIVVYAPNSRDAKNPLNVDHSI